MVGGVEGTYEYSIEGGRWRVGGRSRGIQHRGWEVEGRGYIGIQ